MPVERERKFALELSAEPTITALAETISIIHQGYIQNHKGITARIRQQEVDGDVRHWFTFKRRIDEDVIEIEQRISERDFDALSTCANSWVYKKRVHRDGWEIDFFKSNDTTYFALAEIELPETKIVPDEVPYFVGDYLLYAVPLSDRRFSSKKLADVVYATDLLNELEQTAISQYVH